MRAIRRAGAAAVLMWLSASGAVAGPGVGAEIVVQHAREDTDGLYDPVGFPVSGGGTVTLRWIAAPGVDLVTGVGYEDRSTLDRLTISLPGGTYRGDVQGQWCSLVIPLHARWSVGPLLRLEAGPEWRWLLQSRSRTRNLSSPSLTGPVTYRNQAQIFEVSIGDWFDNTDAYYRSSFAFAAGFGVHWAWLRGDAGVGLRWSESMGNQRESDELRSHFREFQLVMSWDR